MASKITYTSTITVPVYASWNCEKCGEANFATGTIVCKRQESTGSYRLSRQEEAKESAATKVKEEWTGDAFKIISDPNHSGTEMYYNFYLQDTNCTKCGKRPRWSKNEKFLPLVSMCMVLALISGIVAFTTMTSVVAWLVLLASVGVIAWYLLREVVYTNMMPNLPKIYTPVIGSLNAELIEYAEAHGKTIPTPDECIAAVKSYTETVNTAAPEGQLAIESKILVNDTIASPGFCRKCGAKLQADSSFCHKCGTKTAK